ncbi:MAG: glycosyltransferase family 4 protein, partial [Actinomycetota bacterium]
MRVKLDHEGDRSLRLLIVTGIYPPDIGGPATHASDLAASLIEQGHQVATVTLWDGDTVDASVGVVRFPRAWPVPVRMALVARWIARHGRTFDAIYATGLHTEAAIGARLAGVPSIVKIVGDPVWERGRRLGLTDADFEAFQSAGRPRDPRLRALAWLRDRTLRSATVVVTPSRYLADVVETWLRGPADVRVIGNGVRAPLGVPIERADQLRLRVIYVGRLVVHKRIDRLLAALDAGVSLDIVGSGPEGEHLRAAAGDAAVTFHGDLPHAAVLARIAAADVLALASDYEGLPHV